MSDELLDAISRRYAKIRGEYTPEEIIADIIEECMSEEVKPGVWKHTFTPAGLTMGDVADLLERLHPSDPNAIYVSPCRVRQMRRLIRKGKRYERARKRERRQYRAAFRRRKRGLA